MNKNECAAKWWAERLGSDYAAKRNDFKASLLKVLNANPKWHELYCDYDPQDLLLDAVRGAEIECRGSMFSADGMLPRKTGLFQRDGKIESKEGYGAERKVIFPPEVQS